MINHSVECPSCKNLFILQREDDDINWKMDVELNETGKAHTTCPNCEEYLIVLIEKSIEYNIEDVRIDKEVEE